MNKVSWILILGIAFGGSTFSGQLLASGYFGYPEANSWQKSNKQKRHPGKNKNRVKPPAGYDDFMVFLEKGQFDSTMPNPDIPGCFQFFCSGDYFHTEIMRRTLAEVSAIETQAKLYFNMRFGIDVDDPDNMGKLFFRRYYRDPRSALSAYIVSGRVGTQIWLAS